MNILNDYVDKFVITEGDVTFSGLPKESHFLNNKDRFAKWEDKIILNQITIPECESIMAQRNLLSKCHGKSL